MAIITVTHCPPGAPRHLAARKPYPRGATVRTVQTWLRILGHPVAVDGVYGPATAAAVRAIQAAYAGSQTPAGRIVANGITGPATWCLLATLAARAAARPVPRHPVVPRPPVRALAIVAPVLPEARPGVSYLATLSAHGGHPPYVWYVVRGTLPPGLTLLPTGQIAGAPTAPGSATVTVAVRDQTGATATRTLTVTVAAPPTTPTPITGILGTLEGAADRLARRLHVPVGVVEAGAGVVAVGGLYLLTRSRSGGSRGGRR